MIETPFFIPMLAWLILTIIAGKRVKTTFVPKHKNQEQVRKFTEGEKQVISQLAGDINLLLYQSIFLSVLFITTILANFFALITFIFLPTNPIVSSAMSLFFTLIFFWLSTITNKKLDVLIEARECYVQDNKINADFQSRRDEELLRSIREKSQMTEEQAFELGEEVKHTIWNKLKGKVLEHE